MRSSTMDDESNNGFGPISQKRKQRGQLFAASLMLVFLILAYKISGSGYDEVIQLLLCTAVAIFGEVIKGMCLFVEEFFHIRQRYNGSIKKAFGECFPHPHWIYYLTLGVICFVLWKTYEPSYYTLSLMHSLALIFLIPLISYLLGLKKTTPVEFSEMSEAAAKNVADGLALGFYFGFLRLILPHLMEILNLSDNEVDGYPARDLIVDHKLFIVIPKECNCASSFSVVDPNIQYVAEAHQKTISRAGTVRRAYKNSIYKVNSPAHGVFYCLMEYATPLMSMFEMHADSRCNFTSEDRDQQVGMFYRRLKEILDNDERCRGRYHLVLTSNSRESLADVIAKEILKSRLSS